MFRSFFNFSPHFYCIHKHTNILYTKKLANISEKNHKNYTILDIFLFILFHSRTPSRIYVFVSQFSQHPPNGATCMAIWNENRIQNQLDGTVLHSIFFLISLVYCFTAKFYENISPKFKTNGEKHKNRSHFFN